MLQVDPTGIMLCHYLIKSNQIKFNADHEDPYIREERKEKGKNYQTTNYNYASETLQHQLTACTMQLATASEIAWNETVALCIAVLTR